MIRYWRPPERYILTLWERRSRFEAEKLIEGREEKQALMSYESGPAEGSMIRRGRPPRHRIFGLRGKDCRFRFSIG
jgi:hypothetical protein